jgi:hypothetical protein
LFFRFLADSSAGPEFQHLCACPHELAVNVTVQMTRFCETLTIEKVKKVQEKDEVVYQEKEIS